MKKNPSIRFNGFTDAWEQRKWSETVDISTEMVNPKTGEYDSLPHIGPGNIESFTGRILGNVKSVKEDNLISGKFHFYPGDVIYGKINPQLGKYAMVDFEGLASADSYVLNTKNGVSQTFLFTIIQGSSFYKYSVSVSMRTGMPKINRDELNQYSYSAPSVVEQEKIGIFFKQLDNTIALHQRQLVNYKELKNVMQQKIFSQELRFKDEDGNDYSEWDIVSLGMVASVLNGYAFKSNEYNPDGKYKVLTISNVTGQRYANTSETNKMNTLPPNIQSHQLLEKGDILISLTGNVGRVSMVNDENCVLNQRVGLLKLESEKVNHEFIYQYLKNGLFEAKMIQSGQGAAQANISKGDLEEYAVLLPCKKEQQKISNFLYKLEEKIITIEIKILKLKELKKGFIQQMFV
ncbi:restriction endonuclease subunit S [Jeotgalibaca sp. A122]|uniref:restriction endonuclease subunit S n=1 Tax=Jeotgalibaca sp. A122 TaxID=3457322 RepID=UPI003FD185C6